MRALPASYPRVRASFFGVDAAPVMFWPTWTMPSFKNVAVSITPLLSLRALCLGGDSLEPPVGLCGICAPLSPLSFERVASEEGERGERRMAVSAPAAVERSCSSSSSSAESLLLPLTLERAMLGRSHDSACWLASDTLAPML